MKHEKKPSAKTPPESAPTDEVLLIEDLAPTRNVVGGNRRIVFGQTLDATPPKAGDHEP